MRTHKCLWSTFTVLVAAAFTTAAIAADLPKEGDVQRYVFQPWHIQGLSGREGTGRSQLGGRRCNSRYRLPGSHNMALLWLGGCCEWHTAVARLLYTD